MQSHFPNQLFAGLNRTEAAPCSGHASKSGIWAASKLSARRSRSDFRGPTFEVRLSRSDFRLEPSSKKIFLKINSAWTALTYI